MTGCFPLVVDKQDGTLDYFDGIYLARKNNKLPKYFDLESFYKYFIGDSSVRGPNDEHAIKYYVNFTVTTNSYRVMEQAKQQLLEIPFPWQRINELTKLYLVDEAEAKSWLQAIITIMEAILSENNRD